MTKFELWFRKNYANLENTPFLFIATEKHGSHHHLCQNLDDLLKTALFTLKRRKEEGWYDGSMTVAQETRMNEILEKKNGWAALSLLNDRRSYEYEDIEWFEFDSVE